MTPYLSKNDRDACVMYATGVIVRLICFFQNKLVRLNATDSRSKQDDRQQPYLHVNGN